MFYLTKIDDINNIILNYVAQLEHTQKYIKCMNTIENLTHTFEIGQIMIEYMIIQLKNIKTNQYVVDIRLCVFCGEYTNKPYIKYNIIQCKCFK